MQVERFSMRELDSRLWALRLRVSIPFWHFGRQVGRRFVAVVLGSAVLIQRCCVFSLHTRYLEYVGVGCALQVKELQAY